MTIVTRELNSQRWQSAVSLAKGWCDSNTLPCLAVVTGTGKGTAGRVHLGRQKPSDPAPLRDDAIFLIASITKPIVCMGVLLLIERGHFALVDRVVDFIPEFGRHGKYGTEIRHLLTHSSGLPDMLPDNIDLRKVYSPLSRFVERTCDVTPSFPPGRGVQYQSMGIAVLGEIISRVTGKSCPQFLHDEFFQPLDMHETALGAPDDWFDGPSPKIDRIPEAILIQEQAGGTDWTWNSRYWRQLGAPWGGLLTTSTDLAKYAQFMLRGGSTVDGQQLVARATIDAATRNQLECMRDIPEVERRCRPWGLGWRLEWPAHSSNFGDLLGPRTYGHWGASGTVMWIDPDAGTFGIVLTTQPQDQSGKYLSRFSNAIAAAWM
jgi:CubicO group peptidase (beta-lactamase class C family)